MVVAASILCTQVRGPRYEEVWVKQGGDQAPSDCVILETWGRVSFLDPVARSDFIEKATVID